MAKRKAKADQALTTGELDLKALESWLWDAACQVRGPLDAPKFKDYILPLIFLKRLSDVFDDEVQRAAEEFGDLNTARAVIDGDHGLVRFYVPAASRWSFVAAKTTKLGEILTDGQPPNFDIHGPRLCAIATSGLKPAWLRRIRPSGGPSGRQPSASPTPAAPNASIRAARQPQPSGAAFTFSMLGLAWPKSVKPRIEKLKVDFGYSRWWFSTVGPKIGRVPLPGNAVYPATMRDPSKAAPPRTQRFALAGMYVVLGVVFGPVGGLVAGWIFLLLALLMFVIAWRTR